jgi:predicted aconitase with swiveling domain
MDLIGDVLLPGSGEVSGVVLALTAPISFWGGVDPRTGDVIDARHPERGSCVAGTVLALPGTIGSSSASAVLLELVHAGKAPVAILMAEPDAILLLGLVVAREMGLETPPALRMSAGDQRLIADTKVVVSPDGIVKTLRR